MDIQTFSMTVVKILLYNFLCALSLCLYTFCALSLTQERESAQKKCKDRESAQFYDMSHMT